MTVNICERCGKTDRRTSDANIATMSVSARQNGNEEGSFKGSIEACVDCRSAIQVEIAKLMTPDPDLMVRVERLPLQYRPSEGA